MRTKWSLSLLLVLLSMMGTVAHSVYAQSWNPVLTVPGISSVYFLDRQGAPNVGFAAAGSGIYQTTDGGTTWRLCPKTGGYILRDFTFKDAMTGWAVASNTATLLKTTDGGNSWAGLAGPNPGTTIRYAARTHTLFLSYPIIGDAQESTDDGATWTAAPVEGLNGLAFADSDYGIWSSHGNFPIYWTTDGGQLWQTSNLQHHIFSPTPLGSAHSFYALSEVDDSGFLSLDGGATWTYRGSFPSGITPELFYYMAATGCVRFNNGYLWTQTVGDGMFLSTDTGRSWIALCGPSVTYDSRFYARGKSIFAFDDSVLYEDPDGTIVPPPASLVITPDSFRVTVPPCGRSYTFGSIGLVNGCHAELDSLYFTGSNNLTVDQDYLPAQLPEGGTFDFEDRDNGQIKDTGYLHIIWRTNGITKDTVLIVYGAVGGEPKTLSFPTLSDLRVVACSSYDTTVFLNSIACDTLKILSVSLIDSALLQVVSWSPLPAILPSQSSLPIRLRGTFSRPGNYEDSLRVRIAILPAGTIRDTTIPVTIHVGSMARPIVNNITIRARNWCAAIDTVIRVENMHCEAGTLDSISVSDSSVAFVTDSLFPVTLEPDSIVSITLRAQPGKSGSELAMLTLFFTIDSVRIDTEIFVTVETQTKPSPTPVFSSSKISFGLSSVCDTERAALIFRNPQCDTLLLTGLRWSYKDTEMWFNPGSLPVLLAPGEADTVWLQYHPAASHMASGTLDFTFQLDGIDHDTLVGVSGIGTDKPIASLSQDTLSFHTLTHCMMQFDSTLFINTSCDTLFITSVGSASSGQYAIVSPPIPTSVAPGDSALITIEFAPSGDGVFRDSIGIDYNSRTNSGVPPSQTLWLFGSSQTTIQPPELNGADFQAIALSACSDWDTTFSIRNPNLCDSIFIDSATSSTSGLFITSTPTLPAVLDPDSSLTICLHYVPEGDTESISLRLFGTNLDTTIPVSIVRARIDSLSFTPAVAPLFSATPCLPVSETFVLSGGGPCDSIMIDSLGLASVSLSDTQTKFQLSGAPQAPFTLRGSDTLQATYDPNRSGSDSAELIVNSAGRNVVLRIPLVGSAAAMPPVTRCTLTIDGKLRDTIAPGGEATVTLSTLDAIPDSLGLSAISFSLNFNDNLLTKLKINPGPAFIAGPIQSKPGFLSLQLLHPAGSTIAAGSEIGSVDFYVTVGDSAETSIAVGNLVFNPQDTSYERCILSSTVVQDSTFLVVSSSCGTPTLRNELKTGNLTVFGVHPSFNAAGAQLAVDLSVQLTSTVHFKLFTEDGVELSNTVRVLQPGRQTVPMELGRVPHGAIFLQVTDGHEQSVRKLAFE